MEAGLGDCVFFWFDGLASYNTQVCFRILVYTSK
jgi:hypothetical protein